MSYTITEEQRLQLLAALEINRVMGADENGNYTREITPRQITEAMVVLQTLKRKGTLTFLDAFNSVTEPKESKWSEP